jgi:hypothetical protein
MATAGLKRDERTGLAQSYLADRGVTADHRGNYTRQDLVDAILTLGWTPNVTGEPGNWTVELAKDRAPTRFQYSVANDAVLERALLQALDVALSWPTPEQAWRRFDQASRRLLGISAEEFVRRWSANELDADDPHVRHLLMGRPFDR